MPLPWSAKATSSVSPAPASTKKFSTPTLPTTVARTSATSAAKQPPTTPAKAAPSPSASPSRRLPSSTSNGLPRPSFDRSLLEERSHSKENPLPAYVILTREVIGLDFYWTLSARCSPPISLLLRGNSSRLHVGGNALRRYKTR